MKVVSLREYIEKPNPVTIVPGMTLKDYMEGSWGDNMRRVLQSKNPSWGPREIEDEIMRLRNEKRSSSSFDPKTGARVDPATSASNPLEQGQKLLISRINKLIDQFAADVANVAKGLAPKGPAKPREPAWNKNWFFGKNSTWDKYGVGGIWNRLWGGKEGLPKATEESFSLKDFNEIQKFAEEEAEILTRFVCRDLGIRELIEEGAVAPPGAPKPLDAGNKQLSELVNKLKQDIALAIQNTLVGQGGMPGTTKKLLDKSAADAAAPKTDPVSGSVDPSTLADQTSYKELKSILDGLSPDIKSKLFEDADVPDPSDPTKTIKAMGLRSFANKLVTSSAAPAVKADIIQKLKADLDPARGANYNVIRKKMNTLWARAL